MSLQVPLLEKENQNGDSRAKAIISINIWALADVVVASSYKQVAKSGVSLAVFLLFRASFSTFAASFYMVWERNNPFKDLPEVPWLRMKLLLRVVVGQLSFLLSNAALPYVPIFIARVMK